MHVAWHGSERLRSEVIAGLEVMASRAQLGPVGIGDEAVDLFDVTDANLRRVSEAIGWPADLWALCYELFYDGFVMDPLGVRQHVRGVLGFLGVPRPGAALQGVLPDLVVARLTEEPWRATCTTPEVSELLDRFAVAALDGEEGALAGAVEQALRAAASRAAEAGRAPGAEGLHYEVRALEWCRAVAGRGRAPGEVRRLADAEVLDFAARPPPPGAPFPPGYRAAAKRRAEELRALARSQMASARAGRCAWGCPRR